MSVSSGAVTVKDFPNGPSNPDTLTRQLTITDATNLYLECVPYQRGSDTGLAAGDQIVYVISQRSASLTASGAQVPVSSITQIEAAPMPRCQHARGAIPG